MVATPDVEVLTDRITRLRRLRTYTTTRAAAQALKLERYARDPVGFVVDVLGEFLWSRQREIAESVRDHRYTAVHSAHDLGKSYVASRIIAWWLSTAAAGAHFAVSTAPTFAQVRAVLWREIRRAYRAGELPGHVNQTEWWRDDEIIAFGRKPADTDPTAFQGIHAEGVLVVIDEAGGVPEDIWNAVDSLVTNEASRVLAIGNPDDPISHFAKVCKPGSGWNVIHLDGLESPNFTGEDVPAHLGGLLLSPTWVEERRQRWGEASPLYVSKVRGLFPETVQDALIHPAWVTAAQDRYRDIADGLENGEQWAVDHAKAGHVLGVDPARGGGDESVIADRHGVRVRIAYADRDVADTMRLATVTEKLAKALDAGRIAVDVVGIGAGVFDKLRLDGYPVEELHAGWASEIVDELGGRRFDGIRSEWWWAVRELFDPSEIARTGEFLAIDPDDDDLAGQLVELRWRLDTRGRIHVESKEELKSRGVSSPDRADALMHTIARKPKTAETVVHDAREGFRISDV